MCIIQYRILYMIFSGGVIWWKVRFLKEFFRLIFNFGFFCVKLQGEVIKDGKGKLILEFKMVVNIYMCLMEYLRDVE